MKRSTKWALGGAAVIGLAGLFLWSSEASAAPSDDGEGEGGDDDARGTDTLGGTPVKPTVKKGTAQLPPKKATPATPDLIRPRFDPDEHEKTYPTPGYMYQVRKGDLFGGEISDRSIAYRALLSAGYQTAKAHGASDDAATKFARKVAKDTQNRAIYIGAIQCVAINDAAYGTWGYGSKAVPALHGRAIRLLRYHADNRSRLLAGKGLLRNIAIGRWQSSGDGSGKPVSAEDATDYEFLLLPRIDLEVLWQTGKVQINGWNPAFEWTIDTYETDLPKAFGCGGGEMELS